jgi:hypothetical protein
VDGRSFASGGGRLTARPLTALDLQPPLILLGLASGIVNPTFTAGHLAAFSPRAEGSRRA